MALGKRVALPANVPTLVFSGVGNVVLQITHVSSTPAELGDSSVAVGAGFKLNANVNLALNVNSPDEIWAVAGSTTEVGVLEVR